MIEEQTPEQTLEVERLLNMLTKCPLCSSLMSFRHPEFNALKVHFFCGTSIVKYGKRKAEVFEIGRDCKKKESIKNEKVIYKGGIK